jgi:hypothetical protein
MSIEMKTTPEEEHTHLVHCPVPSVKLDDTFY